MKTWLISLLFITYLRVVGWTSRCIYIGEENVPSGPFMYIFWHKYILFASYTHRGRGIRVLASTSRDGDISARANAHFGHRIIRGTASSKREGAKTTLRIISALKKGHSIAITPDGPKGPALQAKPGTSYISGKTGCPMVPIAWAAKKKIIINSWDRTVIPLPFNTIVAETGPAVYRKKDQKIEDSVLEVEEVLNMLSEKVEKAL